MVHRRVGVFHQLAELVAILRAQGDADTGRDKELAALQHKRLHQAGEDLFSDADGAVECHLAGRTGLQQQGEFIAAHARHGVVVVHASKQANGHVFEHAIARGVAQRVIDRLEPVKVEEHQHHPRLIAFSLLQRGVQTVLEQRAVWQVGQGVVIGQAMNTLFTGLAFADVAEEAHIAGQIAFVIEHGRDADPRRVVFTVQALEPDFAFPRVVLVQLLEHVVQMRLLLLIDGEHARQLVEHLRHGVAADSAEGLVGLHDITRGVGNEDGRG